MKIFEYNQIYLLHLQLQTFILFTYGEIEKKKEKAEYMMGYNKKYYERNRERIIERAAKWAKENRAKVREANSKCQKKRAEELKQLREENKKLREELGWYKEHYRMKVDEEVLKGFGYKANED